MRKLKKAIIISILVLSLGSSALTSAFAYSIGHALTDYKQKNVCLIIDLRARISELENSLRRVLTDRTMEVIAPAASDADVTSGEPDTEPFPATGEITAPTLHAPEQPAQTPDDHDTVFVISVYGGIIGVFDSDGQLLRTVNVSVATLPAVDREALAAGIRVTGTAALAAVVEQFE